MGVTSTAGATLADIAEAGTPVAAAACAARACIKAGLIVSLSSSAASPASLAAGANMSTVAFVDALLASSLAATVTNTASLLRPSSDAIRLSMAAVRAELPDNAWAQGRPRNTMRSESRGSITPIEGVIEGEAVFVAVLVADVDPDSVGSADAEDDGVADGTGDADDVELEIAVAVADEVDEEVLVADAVVVLDEVAVADEVDEDVLVEDEVAVAEEVDEEVLVAVAEGAGSCSRYTALPHTLTRSWPAGAITTGARIHKTRGPTAMFQSTFPDAGSSDMRCPSSVQTMRPPPEAAEETAREKTCTVGDRPVLVDHSSEPVTASSART